MTPPFPFSHITQEGTSRWQILKKNWVLSLTNKFVFLFFLLSIGVILLRFQLLPPAVPLWFSRTWGEERLAHPIWLLLLPVSSLILYGINRIVAMYYFYEYLVFVQVLFLSSLLVSFLSFV